MTPEDVAAEYWAHQFADQPPGEQFSDDAFDVDQLDAALADGAHWDDWEDLIHD